MKGKGSPILDPTGAGVPPPKIASRSAPLDVFRVTALFLMTAVHYSTIVPTGDRLTEAMKDLGLVAPALFFFAFGYTLPYFLNKTRDEQVRRLVAFFFVAVLHNLYMGDLFQLDFLSFIFAWNVIVFVVARGPRLGLRVTGPLAAVFLVLLFVLPRGTLAGAFRLVIPGTFPAMPWGLLVLAGLISASVLSTPRRDPYVPFLLLIALALALQLGYLVTGSDHLLISRSPVSGSYVLLLVGCCGTWLQMARSVASAVARVPPLARAVALTSRHLLLATVLHYAAVAAVSNTVFLLFTSDQIRRHDTTFVVVGALAAGLSAYLLLRVVVWAWPPFLRTRPVHYLARHTPLAALLVIPLCAAVTSAAHSVLEAPGASNASWLVRDLPFPQALVAVAKTLSYLAMLYFTLVRDRAFDRSEATRVP